MPNSFNLAQEQSGILGKETKSKQGPGQIGKPGVTKKGLDRNTILGARSKKERQGCKENPREIEQK